MRRLSHTEKVTYLVLGISFLLMGFSGFNNTLSEISYSQGDELTGVYFSPPGVSPWVGGSLSVLFMAIGVFLLSRLRESKGQAAMEFLMTYGWAILVAIIALGVLAIYGVFSPGALAGNSAAVSPPFTIAAFNVYSDGVNFELVNNGADNYEITRILIEGDSIVCDLDGSGSYVLELIVGEQGNVFVGCDSTLEDRFAGDVSISYRKSGSQLVSASTGRVNGKVIDGTSGDSNPESFTLSITKSGGSAGTVTSSPSGINCGSTCSFDYLEGTEVTLSQASFGEFCGWSGGGCSGTGDCEITLNQDLTVNARFESVGNCPGF